MLPQTILKEFVDHRSLAGYTAAVSLHAHTNRSREGMAHVSPYLERIPVVGGFVRRELRAYVERNQAAIDFSKVWWQPPLDAQTVLASEATQIADVLGLRPFVSITDHDTIDANLALRRERSDREVPISLEWTVPFDVGFFHLGVHNLPPATAAALVDALAAFTRQPRPATLAGLLEVLNREPSTLVVLNHPLWDLAGVGPTAHSGLLHRFLCEHGTRVHALELNGYRSLKENAAVQQLSATHRLPLISGGDRHGCAPNALVNLTTASSFDDFVSDVRCRRQSTILVLPEYRRPLVARKVESAAEVMRLYPASPPGQQRWTDRVSFEEDGLVRPLADEWPEGGPWWVRLAIGSFQVGASRPLLPLMQGLAWFAGPSNASRAEPSNGSRPGSSPTMPVTLDAAPSSATHAKPLVAAAAPARRSLNIALVCDGIGDVVGGSFVSTTRFGALLRARGHHVVFVSSGSLGRRHDREYRGAPIHRLVGVRVPRSDGQLYLGIPNPRTLRRIFTDERIDIVHVMIPMPLGLVAARLAKAMGKPVVMHSHTQPENIFMSAPRFPGRERLHQRFCAYVNWLYRQADVMIHPSALSERQFPELTAGRHTVISNGVDRERFRPTRYDGFLARFGLSTTQRYLLYLGRLHREKNVATLIRAMAVIRGQHPDTHLLIVGLGYERSALAALARRCQVAENVTFCGYVPDVDLASAYSACDLFVLPSLAELEGMAVLEAMACGKPLLIADSPNSAAPDFVRGNGCLFHAGDPGDLASQACRMLEDRDALRRMGDASLKLTQQFDIRASATALESVYYSLVPACD